MKMEQRFTPAQLRELRFELLVERARLQRAMGPVLAGYGAQAGTPEGEDNARSRNAVVATDMEARFDAVSAALERLGAGTYGLCSECEQPIPFGRLIVMPESTHCVGCRPRG